MVQSQVNFLETSSNKATERITYFRHRYGEAHLQLAYHAAVPLALTPNLLYRLWADFQWDLNGVDLHVPWVAVTDLLFSCLCDEVGYEIYEMDESTRQELLSRCKQDSRFGKHRIQEVSNFLLTYVQSQLNSPDIDISDFAKAQRWTALTYLDPRQAARELASTLANLGAEELPEWIRLTSVIETFAEELSEYKSLLVYARGMRDFAQGDAKGAAKLLTAVLDENNRIKVAGVNLPIPEQIRANFSRLSLAANFLKKYRQVIGNFLIVIAPLTSLVYFLATRPQVIQPPDSINEVAVALPEIHPLYQTSPATNVNQLRDVSPGDSYYSDLRNLVETYGIIYPYEDGTFRPNRAMTRAELVDLEAKALTVIFKGLEATIQEQIELTKQMTEEEINQLAQNNQVCTSTEPSLRSFTLPDDVKKDNWYYKSYESIGWLTGNDYLAFGGKFEGARSVIRGEMAVFVARLLAGFEPIVASRVQRISELNQQSLYNLNDNQIIASSSSYPIAQTPSVGSLRDVSPGDWYYEDLRELVEKYGSEAGYHDRTYRGNRDATRAEVAVLLNKSLGQLERFIAASVADCRARIVP
ncbi:S-layer homology domain-containing protein [Moorena sp. SIO4A1]|uniref:S-layer homology domain-containing protein n=1 Tax=Moorena sp. SIO4A1 TaxID=2607835 RepID=UPI0025D2EF17|nr:S-layer homology domain-containing protein [Moorena sp. SIO4A1]